MECFAWLAPVRLLRPECHRLLEVLPDHSRPSLVFLAGWLHGEILAVLSLSEQRGPWGQDRIWLPSALPASGPEPALSGVVNYWRSGCPGGGCGGSWLSPRCGGAQAHRHRAGPCRSVAGAARAPCRSVGPSGLATGSSCGGTGRVRQGPQTPPVNTSGRSHSGTCPARWRRGPSGTPASTSQDPRASRRMARSGQAACRRTRPWAREGRDPDAEAEPAAADMRKPGRRAPPAPPMPTCLRSPGWGGGCQLRILPGDGRLTT